MMIETDLFDYIGKGNLLCCFDGECVSCGNIFKKINHELFIYEICEGCYYIRVTEKYDNEITYYKLSRKQLDYIKKNFYKDE